MWRYKAAVLVVSAGLSGLAGGLFAMAQTSAFPDVMSLHYSGYVVMMTLVGGGLVSFWGPVIGAVVFFLARDVIGALTTGWMLWFGLLFVALVLFKPEGIAGMFSGAASARAQARRRRPPPARNRRRGEPMALFEAHDLHLRFGDRVVLENISLAFEAGRLSGIMGPNGAGKTTCFNVLTGRYKPDRGRVLLEGRDITGRSPQEIARLGVARSFQLMSLFDEFTVFENVAIALPGHARARPRRRSARPTPIRRWSPRPTTSWTRSASPTAPTTRPSRCPTARAARSRSPWRWPAGPKLLFLDEPTAGLGSDGRARLAELIAQAQGHPHHRHHRARHGVSVLARRRDLGHSLGPGDRARHAGRAQGQPVGRGLQPGAAQLMLEVSAIDTFYGETQALFGVSLSVGAGEVLALLGANGAGKTTVLRSILGLTRAAARRHPLPGQVHHHARHARDRPRRHRLGAGRPPPVPDADGRQEPVARRQAHAPSAPGRWRR